MDYCRIKAEELNTLYEKFKRMYPTNRSKAKLELYNYLVRNCNIDWNAAVDIVTNLIE